MAKEARMKIQHNLRNLCFMLVIIIWIGIGVSGNNFFINANSMHGKISSCIRGKVHMPAAFMLKI